jgi:hypothetical protein
MLGSAVEEEGLDSNFSVLQVKKLLSGVLDGGQPLRPHWLPGRSNGLQF